MLTKATKSRLEAELADLEETALPAARAAVERGQAAGDIGENPDVRLALDEVVALTRRAEQIKETLKGAEVLEHVDASVVGLGVLVGLEFDGGEVETFLFGSVEDRHERFSVLSAHSPIGQAVVGHRVGDVVSVDLGATLLVRIVSLEVDEGALA